MSGTILLFSVVIAICGAIISGCFGSYDFSRKVVVSSVATTVFLFLFFFGCALRYYNFQHMLISWKHDETIALDIDVTKGIQADVANRLNRIAEDGYEMVWREDYSKIVGCRYDNPSLKSYSAMIFVKDNDEKIVRKSYEDLVKEDRR